MPAAWLYREAAPDLLAANCTTLVEIKIVSIFKLNEKTVQAQFLILLGNQNLQT
jgi:hypothetical protein